jgi:hypothetical protein
LPTFPAKELEKHRSVHDRLWISFKRGVYDVTDFAKTHPGGEELIYEVAGHDIERCWATQQQHVQVEVLKVLEQFRIGNLEHPTTTTTTTSNTTATMAATTTATTTKPLDNRYANEPIRDPVSVWYEFRTNKIFHVNCSVCLYDHRCRSTLSRRVNC